jgi:predicted DsbA family dithiol-disulfide isomerase
LAKKESISPSTGLNGRRIPWTPQTSGADQQGCQDAVVEALFVAYFTEGRDLSNRQTLIDVVAEAGLARHLAEAMLNSDEGMDAFREAEGFSRRHRVEGVPFFIINNQITLSGAQQPVMFLEAFREAVGSQ